MNINELKYITVDKEIISGQPVITGTRFPLAQLLSQLSSRETIPDIAEDFDIDASGLEHALLELAYFIENKLIEFK
tara:strand:+ start:50 stop:277 length:228 start_codon:yes stop_codon:yes gene_type:complete